MDKSFNQIVLERTNKWAADQGYSGYKKESEPKKSAKVKELEKFLVNNGFDGREKAIAELFSIVLDEKVEFTKSSSTSFDIFTMVVPIQNGGDHPKGKPTLVVYQNHGVREDGELGSGLHSGKENVRPATEEEINAFFAVFNVKDTEKKEEVKADEKK